MENNVKYVCFERLFPAVDKETELTRYYLRCNEAKIQVLLLLIPMRFFVLVDFSKPISLLHQRI